MSRKHLWSSSILNNSRLLLRALTFELSCFSDLFYFRIKKSNRLWEISKNIFISRKHSWSSSILNNSRLFLCASTLEIEEDQEWFLDLKIFLDISQSLNDFLILNQKRSEKELSSRVDARKKSLESFKIEEDQEWFLVI
jgi:hypothetical protein